MIGKETGKTSRPAIVLVPGAACRLIFYTDLVEQLSKDFETHAYDLLTASREPPQQAATLADDAAFFHDKIQDLVNAGKDVVVLAHSYGGMPATDSVQGLLKSDRASQGLPGGVVRIVYLSCIVGDVGQTAGELTSDLDFGFMQPVGENGEFLGQILGLEGATTIFSDIPQEEALKWQSRQSLQSTICYAGKAVYPAYRDVPVSYIFYSGDKVLTPEFQQGRIDFLKKEAKEFDLLRLETGHCPNVSEPEATAKIICEAINKKQ
ncbi:uncharacterized protein PV06_09861 [Exophiala oligosperma]|uniref:AB hydrolase-1 domain-containing protein n=1 Tax=Exophiala oligosperma TaxID=215243 RepID=A0A0D2DPW5_9EURO|nr:uncharacterized protein PV06_09861 [Exophiala oligosperma]KIW37879.1 hypothetical protein PV06_09861 [Exophiala oligosperma]